ncbi:nuclease (SNase-like) protein [Rhodobacterales bacterium HTCC2150]|nr:nuclease (SNase-like) protein [Rhodobacterales bacterium HTCC2150] [Rhodobacteraceae bacterium HTCC2150]
MKHFLVAAVLAILPLEIFAQNSEIVGIAQVVDGDTIEIGDIIFRINGIDAPEYGQKCGPAEALWQCGREALALVANLVDGHDVRCNPIEKDNYGRVVGTCYVGDLDIGSEVVRQGLAWAFVRYSTIYIDVENEARLSGRNIWSGPAQPAWEFRAARWEIEQQQAPDGCPIKGNISKNGKIYHPPWSPWYTKTKISIARGEQWFCSEAEAIEAGWRAPKWQ